MNLPDDPRAVAAELARLTECFAKLVLPLSAAQFHWQPEPGRTWSVGQCVDHLQKTNRVYAAALSAAAAQGRAAGRSGPGTMRPNRLGRWFLGMIEPPPRFRVPVPVRELVPRGDGSPETTWSAFLASQDEVGDLLRASSDLDLEGIRFRNPVAKNLRVFNLATGFLIIAAHERRHLAQARRVRELPAFPSA